jgi:hypothetical protein
MRSSAVRWMLVVLGIALVVGPVPGQNSATKKAINAVYAKTMIWYKKKDMVSMLTVVSKDFVMTTTQGKKMTYAEMKNQMTEQIKMIDTITKASYKINKMSMKGKDVVADVTGYSTFKMKGQDGKLHTYAVTVVSKDIWTKTPKGWMMKASTSVKEVVFQDGKKITLPGG